MESFKDIEFDMAAGRIGDGLKKLAVLFELVLHQVIKKNQTERHLHADETRWQVFEFIEGKKSYRWYMWVFVSGSTVVYILDPSRGASILEKHLKAAIVLILSVDRFPSYKSFAKDRKDVILAFCWTHVRRDFLDTANGFSELEAWAMGWVDSIAEIFHLNNQRLKHEIGSAEFVEVDQSLRQAPEAMKQQFESELTEANLHPERAKRLNSLREHWDGLMVFVDHPWIPMDNSEAERRMRIAALGRIRDDWQAKYNYSPVLLETFVQVDRFTGTCYRAANRMQVGITQGRGKLEKSKQGKLPKKYILLYPLVKDLREQLCR